jgi:hypothetical protein
MKSIFFLIAISLSLTVVAQDDGYVYGDNAPKTKDTPKKSGGWDWSRFTVGGGFGMTFGDITVVDVSPTFGYFLTDNLVAGIGGNYTYYNDKRFNFTTSLYGGRVFTEYIFDDLPFIVHTELEVLNVEDFNDGSRINIINPYVGGGIKQRMGGNSYFYIMGLWNLNETPESYALQPNPIIRGGIAIGL